MELSDAIRRRRMVRSYTDAPVADHDLRACLEAATRAPSAGFSQGWDFVVLRSADARAGFWSATAEVDLPVASGEPADASLRAAPDPDTEPARAPDRWLRGVMTAPVLVVVCADRDRYLDRYAEPDKGWSDRDEARWPVPYWDVDAGMAALLVLLTAVDRGLGGLFFGVPAHAHERVHALLGLRPGHRLVGVVALGHPAEHDRRSPSLRRGRRGLDGPDGVAHEGRLGLPLA